MTQPTHEQINRILAANTARCAPEAARQIAEGQLTARPPFGGPAQYAWRCTCGDSQAFSGPLSLSSTWTSAQMHVHLRGGEIA